MKKENRIKKRKEFNYIFKNGECYSSKFVSCLVTKSKLKKFKVGFSASKKVGIAVVRNKVKRRMKEAVYFYRDQLLPKVNYIFVAKVGSDKASYDQILKSINHILNNINASLKVEQNSNKTHNNETTKTQNN